MSTAKTKTSSNPVAVILEACSPQVRDLYSSNAEYQQRVEKLWADTAVDIGPRALRGMGYGYLVGLYYEMPRRATAEAKPMSPEFRNLIAFSRYVGPRPTARHSLHRLNNNAGYCIGNVEWADKRKQAEVRRTTQRHLHLGRRLTDRQLVELLATKGQQTTTGAITKFRQRLAKRGIDPVEITRLIFEKHNLPYDSSADPIESWDFPSDDHHHLTRVYQAFRRNGESRLAFYVRWYTEQADAIETLIHDPLTSSAKKSDLANAEFRYRSLANEAMETLQALHDKKIAKVISETLPIWPRVPHRQQVLKDLNGGATDQFPARADHRPTHTLDEASSDCRESESPVAVLESSILDSYDHGPLIADIERVCEVANVPERYLHQGISRHCGKQEKDWVKQFHTNRSHYAGLLLNGNGNPEARCFAICGALLRNFIDARVLSLNMLLSAVQQRECPDPTVMIIPNLFIGGAGKSLGAWQIRVAHDLLISRFAVRKPTVLYVDNLDFAAITLGDVFYEFLRTHYKIV